MGSAVVNVADDSSPRGDAAGEAAVLWRFGGAAFDETTQQLTVDGAAVATDRRPLQLLGLLLNHAGEVVTKDEIFAELWPDRIVTEASLTKCVTRLRQAVHDDDQTIIRTVHGYGYRFAAAVTAETVRPSLRTLPAAFAFKPGDAVPLRPNWTLLRRLGTGGFGDAWLAEQTKTQECRVFKFGQDGIRLAALRREIALLRLLRNALGDRDDFVHVLDWNLAEPPAFIEIEWSSEGNLAEWFERSGGSTSIGLEERIGLAAQIADALAAAHSVGVLHKDLKPANILVHLDAEGRPKIRLSDFGSGRAIDPSRLGAFGITPFPTEPAGEDVQETSSGTLFYRSPELIAGGVPTVQADIYSLGVILYQLAVGDLAKPMAPGWEHGIADELLREDIGAAAAGDPARRLADAAEIARRLRTRDARRAVLEAERAAQAESERTRRALDLARARRVPLIALFTALVAGLGISTWLYLRAEAAGRVARDEAARARTVTDFLTDDLLSAANPFLAADPNIKVKDLLSSAAASLDHRFRPDSLDRAAIELAIGSADDGLSESGRALPLLRSALATRKKLLGDGDPRTQSVRLEIAEMYERNVDLKAMRRAAQEVLDVERRTERVDPATDLRARYDVTFADCQLKGNSEQCIAPLEPLYAEARSRLGPEDALSIEIESSLAFALSDAQRVGEAVPMARDALALTQKANRTNRLAVLDRKFKLAEVLSEGGHADEAIALLTDVRKSLLAISGSENEATVRAANELAKSYDDAKRYADALPLIRLALDYHVRTRGDAFTLSRIGYNNLANTLAFMGRETEAIPVGQKALALERQALGPDHPETLWIENNLANFYDRARDFTHAEATYRDVLSRARSVFRHGEWDLGHFEWHLGAVLAEEGRKPEARALFEESLAIFTKALGADNPRTQRVKAALAAL